MALYPNMAMPIADTILERMRIASLPNQRGSVSLPMIRSPWKAIRSRRVVLRKISVNIYPPSVMRYVVDIPVPRIGMRTVITTHPNTVTILELYTFFKNSGLTLLIARFTGTVEYMNPVAYEQASTAMVTALYRHAMKSDAAMAEREMIRSGTANFLYITYL